MTVYVDELNEWGWVMYGRRVASCHMIADTPQELHAMAGRLAIQPRHAQTSAAGNLHYDLTPRRRARAVELGARELGRQDFVATLRRLRGAPALDGDTDG